MDETRIRHTKEMPANERTSGRVYRPGTANLAAALTTALPRGAKRAAAALEHTLRERTRAIRLAALFAVAAGLALLLPGTLAHAQGGNIDPNQGADQIFEVIGLIALIAGVVMGIGSLFARRVMAALGFGLAGGLIWAFCNNPEGTLGGAAQWLIEQFTGGGGG